MSMELGKVYIVNNGEYKPLGYVKDMEITAEPSEIEHINYNPIGDTFTMDLHFYIYNNDRKRHGLPLRRGIVNRQFKKSFRSLAELLFSW